MKGAVEVLTRYLAKESGVRKIAVNVVAPGAIETDFGSGHVRDDKELNRQIAKRESFLAMTTARKRGKARGSISVAKGSSALSLTIKNGQ